MKLSDLFKKKELTEQEQKEREYNLEMKKIRRKLWKNPTKVNDFMEESYKLMEKAVKDGVMTKEEHEKTIKKINKDLEIGMKIIRGVRR